MRIFFLACASCFFLPACTNHPLIDDMTGYSTYAVVNKVRCEAREEILWRFERENFGMARNALETFEENQKKLKRIIRSPAHEKFKPAIDKLTQETEALGKQLNDLNNDKERFNAYIDYVLEEAAGLRGEVEKLNGSADQLKVVKAKVDSLEAHVVRIVEDRFDLDTRGRTATEKRAILINWQKKLEPNNRKFFAISKSLAKTKKDIRMPDTVLARYYLFAQSNMAMQFRFEITENDNGIADGSIVWPVALGNITLGYNAGKEKRRFSERTVAVAENFADLLRATTCDDVDVPESPRARIYPVTGNIGMGELISEFIDINESILLAKQDKDKKDKKIFSDKLQFTTTLKGGLKPSLVLSPSTGHTVRFNGDFNADRKDLHEVIVDILPGTEPEDPPETKPTKLNIEKMPDLSIRLTQEKKEAESGKGASH